MAGPVLMGDLAWAIIAAWVAAVCLGLIGGRVWSRTAERGALAELRLLAELGDRLLDALADPEASDDDKLEAERALGRGVRHVRYLLAYPEHLTQGGPHAHT